MGTLLAVLVGAWAMYTVSMLWQLRQFGNDNGTARVG
jgi:hypothetical protein